ncbi:MAG: lysophospholipid acyltransferase family protein [Proteobacteria bacterium]|nr:lysophospholipid acyltransferase family protein [Pseudomonadota bacterium]
MVDSTDAGRGRAARRHALQGALARLTAPVWVPLGALWLRYGRGYAIEGMRASRAFYRRVREESSAPLLVCANHLTLVDSMLVAWALAGPATHVVRFRELPWNIPEARNFAATLWTRIATYLLKCIPIERGGRREDVAGVLKRVGHLLARGETALLFPEGGRSRSGRVEVDSAAWGVGRIIAAAPGCRVLCVYLRGEKQETWSNLPARGDRFHVSVECIEPKSHHRGVRRSRDLARQVVGQLQRMERRHLGASQ